MKVTELPTTNAGQDSTFSEDARNAFMDAVRSRLGSDSFVAPSSSQSLLEWAEAQGLSEEALGRIYADVLNLPFVESLEAERASSSFLDRIPIAFARRNRVLGFERSDGADRELTVAITGPGGWVQLDLIARRLASRVTPVIATRKAIERAINEAYQRTSGKAESVIKSMNSGPIETMISREDLLDVAGRAPVVELVNTVLFESVKARASDLHFQPYEDRVVVRFRIDGVLFDMFDLPKRTQEEVLSRVKVIGRMDIAEKRVPQDGRASVQVGDREVDLRIASLPTSFGERIVVRLLDKSARAYSLGELGMAEDTLGEFRELIRLEHGLVLVTGPTGSGKSTTLYGALQEINSTDRNVVTLEDPIEYQLPGISQTQVNEKKGMTFAGGLRSVLRQDPDIIMVGEIRDQETAVMAIQSALTGHLVFSTLHTNDAASAVTRLLDLGIEPYLVASSLVAVMAQRLVRKTCLACATTRTATDADLQLLGYGLGDDCPITSLTEGLGCDACRQTGHAGRIGLFELITITDPIRDQVQARAHASQIREVAARNGTRFLRDDGVDKVAAGITSIDELIRVTMRANQ